MILSIVSGTYNRLPLLQKMVQTARDNIPVGLTYEFVIVDGGSEDGTIAWCKAQADIYLIEHGELRGAIATFCDGAKAARGKYVLLANDDVHFLPGSILPAIIHLEDHPKAGAVAFADNRPMPSKPATMYRAAYMPAQRSGREVYVVYAQVGLFRRWLGDMVGWWGADDEAFQARTYGGDNLLSSRIWGLGYTVDTVEECKVSDSVADDGLRQINNGGTLYAGEHPDSSAYYAVYPKGAVIPEYPMMANQDTTQLRVLYLPIYEPGHPVQREQKHGLRDALAQYYIVVEMDYLAVPHAELLSELTHILKPFAPHLIISQLHGADSIPIEWIRQLRAEHPKTVWVNWNGDYWPHGLTAPPVMEMLKYIDLQLVVNASVLDDYKQANIQAGYWQIGYEEPGDDLPDMPSFDVVFLANAYSPERKAFGEALYAWAVKRGYAVGLYGSGWEHAAGSNLYDFASAKATIQNARFVIGDNQFPDAYGYVSNRIFQSLAAGGALLLHQTVAGLEELTGLKDSVHYVAWSDFDDLTDTISTLSEKKRKKIAAEGTAFVRQEHSFEARVREFAEYLLPLARRERQDKVALQYSGRKAVGLNAYSHYEVQPDSMFYADPVDVPLLLRNYPTVVTNANVQHEVETIQ